ncbi:MAG: hypothetical protein K8T25_15810, partial [Planctomycetia bacterium]|nr:hypothetical protein [Planctomycetia bacterium]
MACPAAAHVEAIRARNDRDNRWRKLLRCALAAALFVAATTGITMLAPSTALAQVEFSSARRGDVVQFSADEAHRFADGTADVWVLNGHCQINQGPLTTRSRSAVLCIHREDNSPRGRNLVNVYLEGKVAIYEQTPDGISPVAALPAAGGWTGSGESPAAAGQLPAATPKLRAETWVGNLFSDQEPQVRIGRLVDGTQPVLDLYSRAVAAREPTQGQVVRTAEFAIAPAAPTAVGAPPPGTRRLRAFPRSDVRVQAEWFPDTASNEWVAVISGGVNLIIDGAD